MPKSHRTECAKRVALVCLGLLAALAAGGKAGQPSPRVELRAARKTPTRGFAAPVASLVKGPVFVAEKPLFSNGDFTGAKVASTGSGVALLLSFSPKAAKRLEAFTVRSKGSDLALLLDGRVLLVTTLGEPIRGGEMALVADIPFRDAKAVAAALTPPAKGP